MNNFAFLIMAFIVSIIVATIVISSHPSISSPVESPLKSSRLLNLTILHNNDVHARFAPTNIHCGPCYDHPSRCYGGMARTTALVKSIKSRHADPDKVLFLNAGDFYQGTIWYSLFKHQAVTEFVNLMGIDVMTFGNHEFDDGVAGLVPFIDGSTVPIICANIDFSNEPLMNGKINKSMVIERDGIKIGIIGFVIRETDHLSFPGKTLRFLDEVQSVREEAVRLKKEGIQLLIGLSHAGYSRDLKVAAEVPELNLIVGGHTNTFLYSPVDNPPSTEVPTDEYPKIVYHEDDSKTLVVQAFAFGKYLGRLDLSFDPVTEQIIEYNGNPILIDSKYDLDPVVTKAVQRYQQNISKEYEEIIGDSRVVLEMEDCRRRECLFGNLVTDMMVDQFTNLSSLLMKSNGSRGEKWTDFPIAVINSGIFRSSIISGHVRLEDLLATFPFNNEFSAIHVTGSQLLQVLENSVSGYEKHGRRVGGKFLQVSGLKIIYDLEKPVGKRIISVRARCGHCLEPAFHPVNPDQMYPLIAPAYMLNGGDGYSMLKGIDQEDFDQLDLDLVKKYFNTWSPVFTQREERIKFLTDADKSASCNWR